MSGRARRFIDTLLLASVLLVVFVFEPRVESQGQVKTPVHAVGEVRIQVSPDGLSAVLTLDLVGGVRPSDPDDMPTDGLVDWAILLAGLSSPVRDLSGPATVRTSEWSQGRPNYIEVLPEKGTAVLFVMPDVRVAPQRPSTRIVSVCAMLGTWPAGPRHSHEEHGYRLLENAIDGTKGCYIER